MKKKLFNRPVCLMLSEEVFKRIYEITEKEEISVSEFIRKAIQDKFECLNKNENTIVG